MIYFLTMLCICVQFWLMQSWLSRVTAKIDELDRVVALHQAAHKSTLALLKEMNKESST